MFELEEHLAWIKEICKTFENRCPQGMNPDEDLLGYGIIGFYEASAKYDPSFGNTFKTYAEYRIRGAIGDGMREWRCTLSGTRKKKVYCSSIEGEYSIEISKALEKSHGREDEKREILMNIIEKIKRLPHEERIIMMLRIGHDWPKCKIQDVFGLSQRYVEAVEDRALERLREMDKE